MSGTLGVSQDQTLIQTAYATQASGDRDDPSQSVFEEIAYTLPANPMSDRQQAVCGINGDIAGTLDASYYKGCGERQGVEREVVAISFQERGGKPGGGKGILIQEEHVGALSTLDNQRVLACANPWDSQSERAYYGDGAWHSLNANSGGGQNRDSIFCLQGNGIDLADTAGCNGRGWCKDVSYTLNTIDRPAVGPVTCLNDQGGSVMDVSDDVTATLRAQDHGHPPLIAFAQNQRDEVRDLGDAACSLAAEPGMKQQTFVCTDAPSVYENHGQDTRYKPLGDTCETVSAKYGMGGNNQPLVVERKVYDAQRRHGYDEFSGDICETVQASYGTGGGNVPLVVEPIVLESNQNHATITSGGISPTLSASMGLGGGYVPMITDGS